jgi:hypothetical protein
VPSTTASRHCKRRSIASAGLAPIVEQAIQDGRGERISARSRERAIHVAVALLVPVSGHAVVFDVSGERIIAAMVDPREAEPVMVTVGLCAQCRHARTVTTKRSTFLRCELAKTDPRFPRHPRLPVLQCAGFEEKGTQPESVPEACAIDDLRSGRARRSRGEGRSGRGA